VDVLIDKFLKSKIEIPQIIEIINKCFSTRNKISRSYIDERLKKIASYQEQLGKLLRLPKVEQRSQEWHDIRKRLVTASEWAQALGLGKFASQKDFYKKKCGYETITFNPGEAPLKWGTMYEDVALAIYKQRFNVGVYEFGLIPHPSISHFGASPDGINDLGIMVEIKCPYRRKITGEVPQQYYYQIQGQLSVCNLYECDYVECELEEFSDLDTWLEVGTEEKGLIIERNTNDPLNPWSYEYSEVFMVDDTDIKEKAKTFLDKVDKTEECTVRFWTLRVFNCVRVYRDDSFITNKFSELEDIWNKLLVYRENYEIYKSEITPPRKNARSASTKDTEMTPSTNITPSPSMQNGTTLHGYSFLEDD
jgi:putative phage-type endonuclease